MTGVAIDISLSDLQNSPALVQWFRRFGAECLQEAQKLAAERIEGGTGAYERSFDIQLIPGSPPRLLFGNTSPIAIYVEEDTEAHDIVPRNKKSLRWFDPPAGGQGAAVFAQKVRHPGTKGKHIVRDAVSAAGDRLRES
jgi:hypothetical protein